MIDKIINNQSNDIAYIINGKEITYKELHEKAIYYGELLKKEGTSPVILYGHKNIEMFISIFACIYANRTYIPIDLCTPNNRINKIIELTKSSILIKNEKINIDGIKCLKLDDLKEYNNETVKLNNNSIAYIIFTSGSTGEPKGVPISYDNLFNFIKWISNTNPFDSYQKINVLNTASFSFDLSVADIFYSVANGHTIFALDKQNQENYSPIFERLTNIDLIVCTPTFIKLCLLNKDFNANNYSKLKCIYFCGETLEPKTVKKLFDRFPSTTVFNAYGPTEATSAVSGIIITKDMLKEETLPVGEAKNFATKIDVIDDEIILKGESVFNGYLGKTQNNNCYNTGDLGYIKKGLLYCKGRKDNQIKYKGYRIELNDIENNIKQIIGVKECAVVAKYDNNIVKLIKVFVVLEQGYDINYVKEELSKRIPHYMMPKLIKQIQSMPINCNSKIDRKKLIDL